MCSVCGRWLSVCDIGGRGRKQRQNSPASSWYSCLPGSGTLRQSGGRRGHEEDRRVFVAGPAGLSIGARQPSLKAPIVVWAGAKSADVGFGLTAQELAGKHRKFRFFRVTPVFCRNNVAPGNPVIVSHFAVPLRFEICRCLRGCEMV